MSESPKLGKLEDQQWEITLHSRQKFILNGSEYEGLKRLMISGTGTLASFPDKLFDINPSGIASMVCINTGIARLESPFKYKEIDEETREQNLDRLSELRSKIKQL